MKKALFPLLAAVLVPFACAAGIFGSKAEEPAAGQPKAIRKYVLQVPDKKTEKELLDLMRSKNWLTEDVIVLDRLLAERKAKYDNLQGSLQQQYTVERDLQYDYDPSTRSIYALAMPAPGAAATAKTERVLHKQLKNDKDGQRFQGLYRAREDAVIEIRVLQVIRQERQRELLRVDGLLKSKFQMKTGRFYSYDDKNMVLYEVAPARAGASAPAAP